MACIKFSLIVLFFLTETALAQVRFSPKSCLDSEYKMTMLQKGPLFGLLKHEFTIIKKGCIITFIHNKYLPKEWIIDVCREPVHIKVTSATGVDVAKKTSDCVQKDSSRDTSDFCSQYLDLIDVIQDEGLIFAEGDRDNLSSNHGKTFCSYLLIKRYLNDSIVFSRYTSTPDIFQDHPAPPAPEVKEDPKEGEKKEGQQTSVMVLPGNAVTSNF